MSQPATSWIAGTTVQAQGITWQSQLRSVTDHPWRRMAADGQRVTLPGGAASSFGCAPERGE